MRSLLRSRMEPVQVPSGPWPSVSNIGRQTNPSHKFVELSIAAPPAPYDATRWSGHAIPSRGAEPHYFRLAA